MMEEIEKAGAALAAYRRQVGQLTVGEIRHHARRCARDAGLETDPSGEGRSDPVTDAIIAASEK